MDFIFMLTRNDRTVEDCHAVLDRVLPMGLEHIGFKDIGVAPEVLEDLTKRIRVSGATSYLEVVSESPEAVMRSARMAVRLGVDRLLGGTDLAATMTVLAGSGVAYYPFPGEPYDHPTKLAGDAERVARDCAAFLAGGAAGADLLAYRATEADPLDLVRAAKKALGPAQLIVAGSIDGPDRIAALRAAGADGFTIGSAIFDDVFAPDRPGLEAQIDAVLACL